MNKYFIYLLFVCLASFPFCVFTEPATDSPATESIEKPFLWKIEGQKPSYLFGTIHVSDVRVTTLHPSVEKAFQSSEFVYTEIPLDNNTVLLQVSNLLLEGDQKLADIVPADLLTRAEKLLQNINPALTIQPFDGFKVWALATMLPLLEQQLSSPGGQALDIKLYQTAVKQGKEVGGLETLQEQMAIFDNLTLEEEIKMLRDTLEFMEQANAEGTKIAEEFILHYQKGNLEDFGALLVKYVKDDEFSKNFMQKLLHDRNILMADRILKLLEDNPSKSYFFAVGAGHYWGDTGIQNLLAKQGIKVQRLE